MTGPRRAAVLGSPIAHSLSPCLHRAAYAQLGLDWRYDAIEVTQSGLAPFLAGLGPQWAGLSLTMPLKRAVLPLLDGASDMVALTGAANTVVLGPQGRIGHNTDVTGIVRALQGIGAPTAAPAVVLGAGATAGSALAALAQLGCTCVAVLARRPDAAEGLLPLAEALGLPTDVGPLPQVLPERTQAPIVVSTLPVGGSQALAPRVPEHPGWLLDVAYDPWPPPLAAAWVAAGGSAATGDEMLLHQAVEQVRLMTGQQPDVAAMRAGLQAEITRRRVAAQGHAPR